MLSLARGVLLETKATGAYYLPIWILLTYFLLIGERRGKREEIGWEEAGIKFGCGGKEEIGRTNSGCEEKMN